MAESVFLNFIAMHRVYTSKYFWKW